MSKELRNRIWRGKMGCVAAKIGPESADFLDDWVLSLSPYRVSESSLVDLCVSIVRVLYDSGQLSLSPADLVGLLGRPDKLDYRASRMSKLLADAAKFRVAR